MNQISEASQPIVSVLISAYNAEEFIEEAIASVLAQSLNEFEILVMDDGSSDKTFERLNSIKDPRLSVFQQSNSGKSVALNKLLDHVTGKYVTIQDADDSCDPNRLLVLSNILENKPNVGMVQSGYSIILDDKIRAPRRTHYNEAYCKKRIQNYSVPTLDPTMMVRSDLAKRFKFNENLRIGQGLDFILKVGEVADIFVTPEPLYLYRFHFNSITKKKSEDRLRYLLSVTNAARERRGEGLLGVEEYLAENLKYFNDKLNNLSGHFTDSSYWSVFEGRRIESLMTAVTSTLWFFKSGDMNFLKPIVYAFMPLAIAQKFRKG